MLMCANCGKTFTSIVDSIGHLCSRKNLAATLPAMTHPTEQSDRERAEKDAIDALHCYRRGEIKLAEDALAAIASALTPAIRREALLAAAKVQCEGCKKEAPIGPSGLHHIHLGADNYIFEQCKSTAIRNLIDGGE